MTINFQPKAIQELFDSIYGTDAGRRWGRDALHQWPEPDDDPLHGTSIPSPRSSTDTPNTR